MTITASLCTAAAVFLGLEATALGHMAWPLGQNKRTHGLLMLVALLILVALSLLTGHG